VPVLTAKKQKEERREVGVATREQRAQELRSCSK